MRHLAILAVVAGTFALPSCTGAATGDDAGWSEAACQAFFDDASAARESAQEGNVGCDDAADCELVQDPRFECEGPDSSISFCPVAVAVASRDDFEAALETEEEALCEDAPPSCVSAASCPASHAECVEGSCQTVTD